MLTTTQNRSSFSVNSSLSSSISRLLFHSQLKPTCFKILPILHCALPSTLPSKTACSVLCSTVFAFSYFFRYFFCLVLWGKQSWLPVTFSTQVKGTASYCIISYDTECSKQVFHRKPFRAADVGHSQGQISFHCNHRRRRSMTDSQNFLHESNTYFVLNKDPTLLTVTWASTIKF